jgi:hypothetical protein
VNSTKELAVLPTTDNFAAGKALEIARAAERAVAPEPTMVILCGSET